MGQKHYFLWQAIMVVNLVSVDKGLGICELKSLVDLEKERKNPLTWQKWATQSFTFKAFATKLKQCPKFLLG